MDDDEESGVQQVDMQNVRLTRPLLRPQHFREALHSVGGTQEWRNADKPL
jgi:hypothetical protein